MHKRWSLFLVVGYVILLTVLSLVSIGKLPELGSSFDDKVYHFLAYTLLTFILFNYIKTTSIAKPILFVAIVSFIYGTVIEVLQHIVNSARTYDVYDILANFLGVIFATIGLLYINKLKLK